MSGSSVEGSGRMRSPSSWMGSRQPGSAGQKPMLVLCPVGAEEAGQKPPLQVGRKQVFVPLGVLACPDTSKEGPRVDCNSRQMGGVAPVCSGPVCTESGSVVRLQDCQRRFVRVEACLERPL